jgi:hypothetical protein
MKRRSLLLAFISLLIAKPNSAQSSAEGDPWKALNFLEGTWTANTEGGTAGAKGSGTYTFQPELARHVLARHTDTHAGCTGLANYDCQHSDLLYIYPESGNSRLKAIYFDNEGHVIHYDVSTPAPGSALFLSAASEPGPQFRLVYKLKDAIMSGKFEMRMPGQNDWKTYLEWSGTRK